MERYSGFKLCCDVYKGAKVVEKPVSQDNPDKSKIFQFKKQMRRITQTNKR